MTKKKALISADGTPYTPWQTRTRYMCFALIAWALIEIGTGAGFLTAIKVGAIDTSSWIPGLVFGPGTVVSGAVNLFVAICGIIGARNPKRITVFFWGVIGNTVLLSWQVASNCSVGVTDPFTVASLLISFAFAVCAWNVRGQTGYFDQHPHPDDEEDFQQK